MRAEMRKLGEGEGGGGVDIKASLLPPSFLYHQKNVTRKNTRIPRQNSPGNSAGRITHTEASQAGVGREEGDFLVNSRISVCEIEEER